MGLVITSKAKQTQKQLVERTAARRRFHADRTLMAAVASSPAVANDLVPELQIQRVRIKDLKVAPRRIRRAAKKHIANIMRVIAQTGQVAPVIASRDLVMVDGHAVVEALRLLGEEYVSVVCLDHLNEDQIKLLRIALNKLGEGSTWDFDELRLELNHLQIAGYDLTITGMTLPELDIIQQPQADAVAAIVEEVPETPLEPVSQPGDLWELGKQRLLCGDALDERSYAKVLGSAKADACFTDCPWNVPIKGFVSSKHDDFKMAAGEMSEEAFEAFVEAFNRLIAEHLKRGGVLFSCIDWRSHDKIVAAAEKAGLTHINTAVWNKGSGGMGGLYRSAHELIPVFCKGKSPTTNNVELGRHGRDRTNVWSYPGANRPGTSAGKALKHHPTPKPVEMVEDALLDVTNRGELVLDPFLGSGTTLLAAERCGRVAAGIELDPAYVDVCIRRWEEMTGEAAVHSETGLTFEEIAAAGAAEDDDSNEGGE